ncbi:hypothetical protein P7K49_001146, partial [Saguinus oedipus]
MLAHKATNTGNVDSSTTLEHLHMLWDNWSDSIFKKIQDLFASGAFDCLVCSHQLDTIWSHGTTELSIAMQSQHRTGRTPQTERHKLFGITPEIEGKFQVLIQVTQDVQLLN